jgi:hypothetical protein
MVVVVGMFVSAGGEAPVGTGMAIVRRLSDVETICEVGVLQLRQQFRIVHSTELSPEQLPQSWLRSFKSDILLFFGRLWSRVFAVLS